MTENVIQEKPQRAGFWSSIATTHRRYADFRGRASRREFWYWILNCALYDAFIVAFMSLMIYIGVFDLNRGLTGMIAALTLVLAVPTISVAVRRFHDCDRSGLPVALFVAFNGALTLGLLFLLNCDRFNVLNSSNDLNSSLTWLMKYCYVEAAGFLSLIPFNIWFVAALAKRGTLGANRYGVAPTSSLA